MHSVLCVQLRLCVCVCVCVCVCLYVCVTKNVHLHAHLPFNIFAKGTYCSLIHFICHQRCLLYLLSHTQSAIHSISIYAIVPQDSQELFRNIKLLTVLPA